MKRLVSVETLLYIVKGDEVLLIEKKRGLGKGFYNGVGGKVEDGETPIKTAVRECIEEIGVEPINPTWMGVLEFYNDGALYGYVHVFVAKDYKGEPKETEEAKPIWFKIDRLPYDNMWEDDKYWLPLVLKEGKKIYGIFEFVENWKKLIGMKIYELTEKNINI